MELLMNPNYLSRSRLIPVLKALLYRRYIDSLALEKTPRSKEEIINEIDYLYSIADHPEIPREESQRLLEKSKKLNQEFEANGYTHDHVRDDRLLLRSF